MVANCTLIGLICLCYICHNIYSLCLRDVMSDVTTRFDIDSSRTAAVLDVWVVLMTEIKLNLSVNWTIRDGIPTAIIMDPDDNRVEGWKYLNKQFFGDGLWIKCYKIIFSHKFQGRIRNGFCFEVIIVNLGAVLHLACVVMCKFPSFISLAYIKLFTYTY